MHLILILTTALIWFYVASRFVAALPLSVLARAALALVLLALAEYHSILNFVFGSFAAVELPRWSLILIGWAFGTLLLLAALLFVRDVAGGILWLAFRGLGGFWLKSRLLTFAIAAITALLAAYGTWQGVKVPAVKTVSIRLANLPEAFDGYRLVQLSDVHANGLLPAWWVSDVVARTNALDPDLIVITGDLQDGDPAIRLKDVKPLANLRAHDGVLAVPGNHEYYSGYAEWMKIFEDLGLNMLVNSHVQIGRDGQSIAVAGVPDRQARSFHQSIPDIEKAVAGIPEGTPVILLSHRPDNAHASAAAGVSLELAGHTHGGQIWGMHYLAQWANEGFVSGLYSVGNMQLYVSNGTGLWNGLVLRIGRPSEITEIILRRG